MSDGGLKVEQPMESMEALSREAEELKVKLEEERQKLNDVPREYFSKAEVSKISVTFDSVEM